MGKKTKKTAKGRLDKYYHLAKDQGYRARSAFKLIQLNKKYNFLEKSKCLIDLCAAPGSWLQVANKYMPAASLIIGVDLVPIKPISNIITFQEDITSEKCRSKLRNELKNWKADVILHDGAPNVGISWLQDAFSQSELTLKALRLAVEFLNKGGTFLTKIFRSKDYNNLIWIFNQLFGKVEATKPASSRNVSAEIFVICRDYLAPKKIDPKFLDPRSVFQDIDVGSTSKSIDILHPEKKRRNRDGYEDGEYLLYKEIPISEFINSDDPIKILGSASKLKFDDKIKELLNHELTTEEIKACCEDLKVLSRKEFKSLLKWRNAFRKPSQKSDNNENNDNVKIDTKIDEKQDIQEELDKLTEDERIRRKRLRKKANEKRQKNITRMQLKMISPTDIALDNEGGVDDNSLFNLKQIDKSGALKKIRKGDMNLILDQGDNQDDDIVVDIQNKDQQHKHVVNDDITYLEEELDELYEQYTERKAERDAKYRVKKLRTKENDYNDDALDIKSDKDDDDDSDIGNSPEMMQGYDDSSSDSDNDSESSSEKQQSNIKINNEKFKKKKISKLITDLNENENDVDGKIKMSDGLSKRATLFFDNPVFKDILKSDQAKFREQSVKIADNNSNSKEKTKIINKPISDNDSNSKEETKIINKSISDNNSNSREETKIIDKSIETKVQENLSKKEKSKAQKNLSGKENNISQPNCSLKRKVDEIEDNCEDEIEIVPLEKDDGNIWDPNKIDENEIKMKKAQKIGLVTPEAINLAQQLVNRKKTKQELIDDGFRRYTFNDREGLPSWFLDDEKKHNVPNLPITKEAVEAFKERMKALNARPIKKIAEAKARKKFKAFKKLAKFQKKTDAIVETSDMTEKEKAQTISNMVGKLKKPKKKEVKVVVAKGTSKGKKGRPKGVKGRYKMVDARMKKEGRALKRIDKKNGSKKRQKR
ncbi:hypothetical protein Glove_391g3 [Diversispora epigaea]|uniref:Uncharacterized protein n=1 Tax=Diversispora epigaea TaxID=1348612 RepID=A0A397H270_9GLOM|nr:hypothetical protein Glove_391g3 [Diversispora epigaea]